jgi:hypothetical protein
MLFAKRAVMWYLKDFCGILRAKEVLYGLTTLVVRGDLEHEREKQVWVLALGQELPQPP